MDFELAVIDFELAVMDFESAVMDFESAVMDFELAVIDLSWTGEPDILEDNMYFKKLAGDKCYLSPIDTGDAETFTAWLNDQEVIGSLELNAQVITVEGERELLGALAREHNYSIIVNGADTLIGNCGFVHIDHLNQSAEAGIFIGNKTYWDRGYGTEALSLLMDFGFRTLNLHNIMLRVYSFNQRALTMYEKIGFKRIGVRRESLQRNRQRHDIVYLDILEEDFYPRGGLQWALRD
jgi:RimJ/RimL family protein N-acetyltransferase